MTDDIERLRADLRALAAANRRLAERIELADRHRRAELGDDWLAELAAHPVEGSPRLVKAPTGTVYVVEGGHKRTLRSGLLALALEGQLGAPGAEADDELDGLPEGPPVEVLEGPQGAPFVVVGGRRLPIRGLPLPHPVRVDALVALDEGPTVDIGSTKDLDLHRPGDVAAATAEDRGLPLPTFLIIGAQKSATRWLRTNLDAHPDVFTAPGEPGFFNDEHRFKREGLSWYRQQFRGWAGEPCVGESTPGYLMWTEGPAEIAQRVRSVVPDARLIALLRNPIDRARSALVHHVVKGRLPKETNLVELVTRIRPEQDQLGLVAGGWYAASLDPYLQRFGDQVLVLVYDDLVADPRATFARAIGHIGAARGFVPDSIDRVRESQEGLDHEISPLGYDDRMRLWELFEPDVRRLEAVLGRSLAVWEPRPDDEAAVPAADDASAPSATPAPADGSPAPAVG